MTKNIKTVAVTAGTSTPSIIQPNIIKYFETI
jgi:4-hydroxy-3-methylbut-2-enyl diphosphate reductase IspH